MAPKPHWALATAWTARHAVFEQICKVKPGIPPTAHIGYLLRASPDEAYLSWLQELAGLVDRQRCLAPRIQSGWNALGWMRYGYQTMQADNLTALRKVSAYYQHSPRRNTSSGL